MNHRTPKQMATKRPGWTPARAVLLLHGHPEGLTTCQFAHVFGKSPSVLRRLDSIAAAGLVIGVKRRGRRSITWMLTPAGLDLVAEVESRRARTGIRAA